MTRLLEGKAALISGVGPGMGRYIAVLFAEHGADVVLGARNTERVDAVAAEVRELGARAEVVRLDITDRLSCDAAVEAAVGALGRVDVLVNNAFRDINRRLFEESNVSDYRKAVDVNLLGTLEMTQAVIPTMKEQGGGRIIMVNSMSAHRIQPTFGAYTASKAALESVTKTLAVELGPHGIRVNGIHPGYIWGDSVQWYFSHLAEERGITADEVYEEVASGAALRYLPPSREIVGTIVFLASDLASPVTGQSIGVDCGHWIAGVIKLTCLLKRNPSLSVEEFREHWRTTHADLIQSVPGIDRWLVRYVQRLPLEVPSGWTGTSDFDGITEQWFESYDDFVAMISDPGYRATVTPDEQVLLDMGGIVCLITDEARPVVDGRGD